MLVSDLSILRALHEKVIIFQNQSKERLPNNLEIKKNTTQKYTHRNSHRDSNKMVVREKERKTLMKCCIIKLESNQRNRELLITFYPRRL
jgi:hypothetical protein